MNFILKGLVIGFSIAAPVGPIGVLCIRRSLVEGRKVGLVTGLGAATADVAYGCVAAFGLTAISSFLVGHKSWLSSLGGLYLCYLGIWTFISNPSSQVADTRSSGLLTAYLSAFFLTTTNPMTILSFVAIFAGLGLGTASTFLAAGLLVVGIFIGSVLWWLLLSSGVAIFQSRVSSNWMQIVNRFSGSVIFAFGIYSLSTLF